MCHESLNIFLSRYDLRIQVNKKVYLGNLGSEFLVPGGVLEEIYKLQYLNLCFLAPGHVPEPGADVSLLYHLRV